jgi:hypothetical protein
MDSGFNSKTPRVSLEKMAPRRGIISFWPHDLRSRAGIRTGAQCGSSDLGPAAKSAPCHELFRAHGLPSDGPGFKRRRGMHLLNQERLSKIRRPRHPFYRSNIGRQHRDRWSEGFVLFWLATGGGAHPVRWWRHCRAAQIHYIEPELAIGWSYTTRRLKRSKRGKHTPWAGWQWDLGSVMAAPRRTAHAVINARREVPMVTLCSRQHLIIVILQWWLPLLSVHRDQILVWHSRFSLLLLAMASPSSTWRPFWCVGMYKYYGKGARLAGRESRRLFFWSSLWSCINLLQIWCFWCYCLVILHEVGSALIASGRSF